MTMTNMQFGSMLETFKRDGASPQIAKRTATTLGISESLALESANLYRKSFEEAFATTRAALGLTEPAESARNRQLRESAERLVARANAAEARGLDKATTQELEALTALALGHSG